MKKIISIVALILCAVLCFAGCGKQMGKSGKRASYNYDLTDYVTLGKYKGIEVDTKSELYQNYYKSFYESDVAAKNAYATVDVIAKGDIANIDYSGKLVDTGKVFEGGTAEKQDLAIGSGTFIDGFEDQLVGAKVGATVVVKVTFPKDYTAKDLAGKRADFTVKVNSVKRIPELTEAVAVKLGFKNLKEYNEDLQSRIVENVIYEIVLDSKDFVIKSYPDEEKAKYDTMYNDYMSYAEQQAAAYNAQYKTQLKAEDMLYYMTGMTSDQFKSYYDSALKSELIFYAIFDAEKLRYTTEEYEADLAEMATNDGTTVEEVKANYEEWVLEANTIKKAAMRFMVENAIIK